MNGPVLVTGAAGFAGSHLLERLTARCELVAWARVRPERRDEQPPSAPIILEAWCGLRAWTNMPTLRFAVAGAAPMKEKTRVMYSEPVLSATL